ncbi:hypothetical protein GCM10007173_34890 [Glutamicibacter ardleyensis]|uniref:Uncharacterized protein n=1 Tax=Glutamicibacter ardleyensis TaxID=225894 RepID=A0ABQ2DTZ3_9MICC|nr:hypothetical protein GCM10007173_34890 [Glutamicibacter ardleyensis]
MTDKNSIPNATAIDAWPNQTYRGFFVIEVDCPHCPKTHTHGVDSISEPAGIASLIVV